MIRAIVPDDTTALLALAEATGLFQPQEIEELAQMLTAHFEDKGDSSGFWLTDDDNGLVGVCSSKLDGRRISPWARYAKILSTVADIVRLDVSNQ
jgi:hypothetical protein